MTPAETFLALMASIASVMLLAYALWWAVEWAMRWAVRKYGKHHD